ncbi:MAG TPA: gamma-glutamyl-gamma-aminobutyrate hydrolase family protein [Chloroflexi bacterium]|nr:gamma-glutamyl-gamma-aminobutyrate hydrolase family protein [Chloroflexota bacterium]
MKSSTSPQIGITIGHNAGSPPVYELGAAYLQAVTKAGGTPLLLPTSLPHDSLLSLFQQCSGLLLSGGRDVDPLRYQTRPDPRAKGIDHDRDEAEILLIEIALANGIPILAICRGIQILNVAMGGSLYPDVMQDHPGAQKHDFYPNLPRDAYRHTITLASGSLLQTIMNTDMIQVNSLHHQSIKSPASGLQVVGMAEDDTIEAVVAPHKDWVIGVQWHPECLPQDTHAQKLFAAFIETARKRNKQP